MRHPGVARFRPRFSNLLNVPNVIRRIHRLFCRQRFELRRPLLIDQRQPFKKLRLGLRIQLLLVRHQFQRTLEVSALRELGGGALQAGDRLRNQPFAGRLRGDFAREIVKISQAALMLCQ